VLLSSASQKNFAMKDVLFFDSMLTPKIIIFIYWLGLISVVLAALGSMFSGYGGGILVWPGDIAVRPDWHTNLV
jgi:hypothetical protein